jgi:CubicO group peptidase (beta-lactamase class C family)
MAKSETINLNKAKRIFLVFYALLVIAGYLYFSSRPASIDRGPETFQPAYWPISHWRMKTPEEVGVDSQELIEVFNIIEEMDVNVHHLLVIRDGYILLEADFYPFKKEVKHQVFSITKCFTGTLVGMAIEDGILPGVQTPVLELYSSIPVENPHPWKGKITIEHLLTMTSGMAWNESYSDPSANSREEMISGEDWAGYVLNKPMETRPGKSFRYNSGNSVLLMNAIEMRSGENSVAYADRKLLAPLGITDYHWFTDEKNTANGGTGLVLKARDVAKLGMLYLYQGEWAGNQLVSEEWISQSTWPQSDPGNPGVKYGYHWWILPEGFYAAGSGGQNIYVLPAMELIVLVTAGEPFGIPSEILYQGILPAVKSAEPLPDNPDAAAELYKAAARVGSPPEQKIVWLMPDLSALVNQKRYVAEINDLGLRAFALDIDGDILVMNFDYGDETVSWEAGFDHQYRYSPVYDYGSTPIPVAARAYWQDDLNLVIESQPLFSIHLETISLHFGEGGKTVEVSWQRGRSLVRFSAVQE